MTGVSQRLAAAGAMPFYIANITTIAYRLMLILTFLSMTNL